MLKSELVALVEVPTTILGEDGQPKKAIGTAYPIRKGLVITARHVLYHDKMNLEKKRILSWRYPNKEEPYHQVEIDQDDIVFEEKDTFDIAVVKCDTSGLELPLEILGEDFPDEGDVWKTRGFPRAGVEFGLRKQIRTGGTFTTSDAHDRLLDLRVRDKLRFKGKTIDLNDKRSIDIATDIESEFWKGMSGAPIFHRQTNKLVGIWLRGSNRDKTGREIFRNRLIAVSIPYLLHGDHCPKFREKVFSASQDQLIAHYFNKMANWLEQHSKAKQAIWSKLSKTDTALKDCPVALVNKLKTLPISKLLDIIFDAHAQTTDVTVKSELVSVFKRLLPVFYEQDSMLDLYEKKQKAGMLIGIPFATPVSAEILMAATDQRDVDFVFRPVSNKNSRPAAHPGQYCLPVPPESGSISPKDMEKMMSDDLIWRFGLSDLDMDAIDIAVDDYLYKNIAPQRRRFKLTREQRREAVQRELRRLQSDSEQGTYYWLFVSEDGQQTNQHCNQLAFLVGDKYPQISCLSLEGGYDKEQDEEDLFASLYKILKPEVP